MLLSPEWNGKRRQTCRVCRAHGVSCWQEPMSSWGWCHICPHGHMFTMGKETFLPSLWALFLQHWAGCMIFTILTVTPVVASSFHPSGSCWITLRGVRKSELGFSCSLWDFISVVAVAVGNYSLVFEGNSSAMNSSAKLHLPALVAQTHLGKEGFRRSPIGLYRPLLEKFISWVSSRRGPPKFAQDNAWQWGRQLGRLWVCSCHCQCARACVDCL